MRKRIFKKRAIASMMAVAMTFSLFPTADVYATEVEGIEGNVTEVTTEEVSFAEGFVYWFNTDGATGASAGQQGNYPIYLGENMAAKTNQITVDGTAYYSVQGSSNPKKNGNNPNGSIPTTGAYLEVKAPAEGTITVYGYPAAGKPFYGTTGDVATLTDGNAFSEYSYTVTTAAEEDWFFYAQGSKAQFVGVKFELPKADVTIPVELTGAALGNAIVSFTNQTTGDVVTILEGSTEITLKEGYRYTVSIDSSVLVVNLAEVDLTATIPEKIQIQVEEAAKHQVSGQIKGLPGDAVVSSLIFTDEAGASTEAAVTGTAFSVDLKNGSYTTSAQVENADAYTVFDHVSVSGTEGEEISDDVWFYGPSATYSAEYRETLQVGTSEGCDYATITEALAAVKAMTRTADQDVTLILCDAEYVEQVIVDSANVKMVAAENVAPVIRWYYGIGYKYYSIDDTGYYNVKFANDKYEMHYAQRWGATVRVKANGFQAEGISFVNTFNRYVCEEELGDSVIGSASEYGQSISGSLQERTLTTDVANGTNVERAAAMALDADEAEFYGCSFTSSQDTLYTGSAKSYFRDCVIIGQTDYIFGNTGTKAIFDQCELRWLGYTAGSKAGYITATRDAYLFRGCKVTNAKEADHVVTPGYFGRPWGNLAQVAFVGTEIEKNAIVDAGWYSMSGVNPENATFREYGNTCEGVNFYSTYATADATKAQFQLTKADATQLADPNNDSVYFGNWKPEHRMTSALDLSAVANWGTVSGSQEEDDKQDEVPATAASYVLDASELAAFAAGTKADGEEEKVGTDQYYTVIYSAKSKVDASSKSFEDGYTSSQRINLGGVASTEKNAVKFTTSNKATVKVWWVEAGDDNRQMAILNAAGEKVAITDVTLAKNATAISTFTLDEAGTYYLGGATNNNYIFKVVVEDTVGGAAEKPERKAWAEVVAPEVTATVNQDGTITATVKAVVGYDGADKVTVTMSDEAGIVEETRNSSKEAEEHVLVFTPTHSGNYFLSVVALRDGEEEKAGNTAVADGFVYPLVAPAVNSVTNKGNGTIEVTWDAAKEANYYVVTVDGVAQAETKETMAMVNGLTIGKTYTIGVKAARDKEDQSAIGATAKILVKDEVQRTWGFSVYGTSIDTKNNGYNGSANDGEVTVYSLGGKGKIVPNTTDGLAYYYTVMDPATENFTLEADVNVDHWTLSNGQDGFGLMVADTIGSNGSTDTVWNNSIQNIVTKIEYYFDGEKVTNDTTASKITMKLGVGALVRLGVTASDVASLKNNGVFQYADGSTAAIPEGFSTSTSTLETSCGKKGTGTYNIIGNYTKEPTGTVVDQVVTTLHMSIQRNNTGYVVTYADKQGNVIGKKLIYDLDRNALTQIESDKIYVGFFASRNAKVTYNNIQLTVMDPKDDAPAEEREVEKVAPVYTIDSATTANSENYDLVFYGNADGVISISDQKQNVIAKQVAVQAKTKTHFATKLGQGDNTFSITFTPDKDYRPSEYQILSSYETVRFTHTVTLNQYQGTTIYVAPNADGKGTKENPASVQEAVKFVKPGQTILLAEGTYSLSSTLKVDRGIDGTQESLIRMIANPEATGRVVFDFQGKCAGLVVAGDYWYFQGFDVTRSADAQKGILVAGSHNVFDGIRAYKNGNTGIQIGRYKSTDGREEWPSDNLILNCTSYMNADKGYEDADGFAAKLTIGEGNVFDGCISAYNADDGWDLYAKAETGAIGKVVLKNCVAFKNGYVLDTDGSLINAGNGNGFKMGGESMSGYHTLINSVAFANKAKGIDSNSCPDIQIYQSTSYDNESYNVAFYTNNAINTDFLADGILSFKTSNDVAEQMKLKGTQDNSKVYGETNYYTYSKEDSYNSENSKVTADWFVNLDTTVVLNAATEKILANTFGLASEEQTGIVRHADGTINMNGYLVLTEKADAKAGARMSGTPSGEIPSETPSEEVTEIKNEMGTWVSGTYAMNNASVEENATRIRLVETFEAEAGHIYEAKISDTSITFIVRAKNASGKVKTFYLSNRDRFTAEEGVTYYMSAYHPSSIFTFEEYVSLFQNGLVLTIEDVSEKAKTEITEVEANLSIGQKSKWVSGSYSQVGAKEEVNRVRIRLADALEVVPGKTVVASITTKGNKENSFRFIVRMVDAEGKTTTVYLNDGQTLLIEDGITYYVSVHNMLGNYKDLDFEKYLDLMKEGLAFDFSYVEEKDEITEDTTEETTPSNSIPGQTEEVVDPGFTHPTIGTAVSTIVNNVVDTISGWFHSISKWFH